MPGVGFSGVFVHLTNRLSNFGIISDYLKVGDNIEKWVICVRNGSNGRNVKLLTNLLA